MKKLNILLFMCFACAIISCGGEDIDCADTVAIEASFQDELSAANAAVSAFNADNSEDNCKTLKDALNDYKDALNDIESCVSEENRADFEATIQSIDDDLTSINC